MPLVQAPRWMDHSRAMRPHTTLSLISLLLTGCSQIAEPAGPTPCAPDEERFRGSCVDPAHRYEPGSRMDPDNVVAFGEPLTELDLPEPPKSGFRLIAAPRTLAPGEEVEECIAWPFPSLKRRVIHAGRLYTTPGLHHSNLISKPVDAALGPSPYPGCQPGAAEPFSELPAVIPDVLFANSTQVEGGETLVFSPGMGFEIDPAREIATSVHFLNTTSAPLRVEVAYDFFTMGDEDVENYVAPFAMQVNDFRIPPHAEGSVGASCNVFGGKVVSMMQHTHKLLQRFTVDLERSEGGEERVMESGAFDTSSDIRRYAPPIELGEFDKLRYECTFNNRTDHDLVYGLGDNEMCVLFGYIYPVTKQFVSFSKYQGEPCTSVQIGLFR